MKLEEIYQYFTNPPLLYLSHQQAVCYILSVLLEGDSYGTELIQKLKNEHSSYRLSDTVLFGAMKFLDESVAITTYWKKMERRGRPRKMYQLNDGWREEAKKLAGFWTEKAKQKQEYQKLVTTEAPTFISRVAIR